MLTAAITAAIGAVLAFFGVEPGPYLVGVAIGVKVVIVATVALFGARWAQKRAAKARAVTAPAAQASASSAATTAPLDPPPNAR